jgi:hypothetical protein
VLIRKLVLSREREGTGDSHTVSLGQQVTDEFGNGYKDRHVETVTAGL